MHIRVAGLALLSAIGIGVAVTSCGSIAPATVQPLPTAIGSVSGAASASSAASPGGSSSASTVPTGYTRVGGAAAGISVAAPSSWVAVDMSKETLTAAAKALDVSGISAATLIQDMQTLQKVHGVAVWDVKSAKTSPQHFARNLNAYCAASGVSSVGAAGVALLRSAAVQGFTNEGGTHITQQDLPIGGVPGVETSYQIDSPTVGTIYQSQLEVMPKPSKVCFVTVTYGEGEPAGNVTSVAAATAEFP